MDHELGTGIYSIPDVAFILKLPTQKVRRWMKEFWDGKFSTTHQSEYSWGKGKEKVTHFHSLIEFYVFYQLRELNVSTPKIFLAHKTMAEQLQTAHPFASSKLLSDGKHILFTLQDGTIVKADTSKQSAFKEIIESFCKKIEFSTTNIAESFYPMGKEKHIVVDPQHQFGQPIIEDTNILAETIVDLYSAGETVSFISRLYNLPSQSIEDAILFFSSKKAA